jgi:hypothetical protein
VILWNSDHDWVSFAFQSGRALDRGGHLIHIGNLAKTLAGQMAYVWPPSWVIAHLMLWRAIKEPESDSDRYFALIALAPIAIFDLIALFSTHSLPHWPMYGFLFAFPLVGRWCAEYAARRPSLTHISFATAAVFVPLAAGVFAAEARSAALTRAFYARAPRWELDWQSADWSVLAPALRDDKDFSFTDSFVVAPNWMQAAKIGYALGPGVPIEVAGDDPRHFQFLDAARLRSRHKGFFVAALEFKNEDARERAYRSALAGRFTPAGEARRITQALAGFPTFDILVLPITGDAASVGASPSGPSTRGPVR